MRTVRIVILRPTSRLPVDDLNSILLISAITPSFVSGESLPILRRCRTRNHVRLQSSAGTAKNPSINRPSNSVTIVTLIQSFRPTEVRPWRWPVSTVTALTPVVLIFSRLRSSKTVSNATNWDSNRRVNCRIRTRQSSAESWSIDSPGNRSRFPPPQMRLEAPQSVP